MEFFPFKLFLMLFLLSQQERIQGLDLATSDLDHDEDLDEGRYMVHSPLKRNKRFDPLSGFLQDQQTCTISGGICLDSSTCCGSSCVQTADEKFKTCCRSPGDRCDSKTVCCGTSVCAVQDPNTEGTCCILEGYHCTAGQFCCDSTACPGTGKKCCISPGRPCIDVSDCCFQDQVECKAKPGLDPNVPNAKACCPKKGDPQCTGTIAMM